MDAAITENQRAYLTEEQVRSSRAIMGLDTQIVDDRTYSLVEIGGETAGCGGWSRRATLYGGNLTPGRDAALLDPARDAARLRAMYTHPKYTRRGIGRLIIDLCEMAAVSEGFGHMELMATMSGLPLYEACGYVKVEALSDSRGGAPVPLVRMRKRLR